MGLYFLKRLLLVLPTLWVISSIIFLLGRLLPGPAGSQMFFRDTEASYGETGNAARLEAYRSYLRRTGQDKPIFYFGLSSGAEPDTLHRIFPDRDQELVRRLLFRFGHWPSVSSFYRQYAVFRERVSGLPASPLKVFLLQKTDEALVEAAHPETYQFFDGQHEHLVTIIRSELLAAEANRTAVAYAAMVRNASPGLTLLPSLHWHGLENQYHAWFQNLLRGNLGTSFRDGQPVGELLREALGNTIWLMLGSFCVAMVLGMEVSLGLYRRQMRPWAKPILGILYVIDSIPLFIQALGLLLLFSGTVLFPTFPLYYPSLAGNGPSWIEGFSFRLYFLALPLICLSLARLPYIAGQAQRALQESLSAAYIITARAKGLPENRVLRQHALRNSLLPIITLISDFLPSLVAGALVIEVVFAIPGVGRLLTESVLARDYPVVMGIVLLVALVKMFALLLADLGYYLADPRLKKRS
jgi:peptide/nickel transport system permease protein